MAAKIKTTLGTGQGFEIKANREGLMELAYSCLVLAMLPEDMDPTKVCNHAHFAQWAENLEEGSSEFIITYKPNL